MYFHQWQPFQILLGKHTIQGTTASNTKPETASGKTCSGHPCPYHGPLHLLCARSLHHGKNHSQDAKKNHALFWTLQRNCKTHVFCATCTFCYGISWRDVSPLASRQETKRWHGNIRCAAKTRRNHHKHGSGSALPEHAGTCHLTGFILTRKASSQV